jgi:uncharacterized protein YjiS (DUF1127 family)
MRKLIPTRHFFERVKCRMTFRAQLSELSDWSLKDIGIFRQVSGVDAVKPFWMP